MHRGEAVSSRGGYSRGLCLGRGGVVGSGCEELVRASTLSGSNVFQRVVCADEGLFPLTQVFNFEEAGLSSFDKFHDLVEYSVPYNMN